jgi:hypothetical protein
MFLEGELVIFSAVPPRGFGFSSGLAQGLYLMIGEYQQK